MLDRRSCQSWLNRLDMLECFVLNSLFVMVNWQLLEALLKILVNCGLLLEVWRALPRSSISWEQLDDFSSRAWNRINDIFLVALFLASCEELPDFVGGWSDHLVADVAYVTHVGEAEVENAHIAHVWLISVLLVSLLLRVLQLPDFLLIALDEIHLRGTSATTRGSGSEAAFEFEFLGLKLTSNGFAETCFSGISLFGQ